MTDSDPPPTGASAIPPSGQDSTRTTVPILGLVQMGDADRTPPAPDLPPESGPGLTEVDPAHYQIEGEVAHGGMGRVFLAHDLRLGRQVAIKQLLEHDPELLRRFEREARITAGLQHPGIVNVYEAGCWPTGEPFYAMRMVPGRSLAEVIDARHGLADRLALLPTLISVAEAVAYAHSRGIVHRDLKPENVLVGEFGETVVIDWGLAKDLRSPSDAHGATREEPAEPPRQGTLSGMVMGTPAFMAPEQAMGRPVDERADVYALGAMLYHALTGRRPYYGRDSKSILRKLMNGPPAAIEERRMPRDLSAIVHKAMAREAGSRYPTARELADELKRYHMGKLVDAYRYTRAELGWRWIRQHRAAVVVAAVALALLVTVVAIAFRRNVQERRLAQQGQHQALRKADELILFQARSFLEREPASALAWLLGLSSDDTAWRRARIIAADAVARGIPKILQGHDGLVTTAQFAPDGTRIVSASADRTVRIWDPDTGTSLALTGHGAYVSQAIFAPGGASVASAANDGTVRVWDLTASPPQGRILRGHQGRVSSIDFASDTLLASGSDDGTVRLWDLPSHESRTLGELRTPVRQVLFAPGQDTLAAPGDDGGIRVWSLPAGEERTLAGHAGGVARVAFSADGVKLASAGDDRTVRLWDVATGAGRVVGVHEARVTDVAFLPPARGGWLVSADDNGTLRLWGEGAVGARSLHAHGSGVSRLAVSEDGRLVASAGHDSVVTLWDWERGESVALTGHDLWIYGVAFSPDGTRIVSAGGDKTLRVWSVGRSDRVLRGHDGWATQVAFSKDGSQVISLGRDNTVRSWSRTTGKVLRVRELADAPLGMTPDGATISSGGIDGTIHVRPLAGTGPERALQGHSGETMSLALSADGTRLASAGSDHKVLVWDVATSALRLEQTCEDDVLTLAFSPDGARLAAGSERRVHLWDLKAGTEHHWQGHETAVTKVRFSPDGATIVSASPDMTARLWNVATGASRVLRGHEGTVSDAVFSPDGSAVATASSDTTVRLWDVATGKARVLRGHDDMATCVAFSPDGRMLASGSSDKTARLWDTVTGESRALRGHDDRVMHVAFSPDGATIATASKDGTVRLFADDLPRDAAPLRQRLESIVAAGGASSGPTP